MSRFFNGTSSYLTVAASPVTGVPLTLATWFFPTVSQIGMMVSVGDPTGVQGSTTDSFDFALRTAGVLRASSVHNAVGVNADTAALYQLNAWNHGAAVFASSTSRTCYCNGIAGTTNTTSNVPDGISQTQLGARIQTVPANFYPGLLAHAAIWNLALVQSDITLLASGVSPTLVRPENLMAYWPLDGNLSPELDVVFGRYSVAPTLSYAGPPFALRQVA